MNKSLDRLTAYMEENNVDDKTISAISTHLALLADVADERYDSHSYILGYYLAMIEAEVIPPRARHLLVGGLNAFLTKDHISLEESERQAQEVQQIIKSVYEGTDAP